MFIVLNSFLFNFKYSENLEEQKQFSITKELKNKETLFNLIIVVVCFTFVSFDFYMIGFYMKYIGGNLYINVLMSIISDNLGNFGAFILQKVFGTKCSFVTMFILATIFGIPLIFYDQEWILATWILKFFPS